MNDAEVILRLLSQCEGEVLDFKSCPLEIEKDYQKGHFVKDIICMANTPRQTSSYILYGVSAKSDGGKYIQGVLSHPDDANLQTLVKSAVNPTPHFHYRPVSTGAISVGILEIFPKRDGPYLPTKSLPTIKQGMVYFRRGSSNAEADSNDINKISAWMEEEDQEAERSHTPDVPQETIRNMGKFLCTELCDLPPENRSWVGRIEESRILDGIEKVVFLSGIGGQGKSGLASRYVLTSSSKGSYDFWDWRDLKEEENRLFGKLSDILIRLSKSELTMKHLKGLSIEGLIEGLFQYLGDKKALFVFDNIDRYIDMNTLQPVHGMDKLVYAALQKKHNSKFIFTCRPTIDYISPDFCRINLSGLSLDDTLLLFESYHIPINKQEIDNIISKAHALTKGHPLWLSLIAAQAVRGLENVRAFLKNLEYNRATDDEVSSPLSENILNTVWDSLNLDQRNLLRALSETVRSEQEDILVNLVADVLHANRFYKALKTLKLFNLVVIKSAVGESNQIELHPLVRYYVRCKYDIDHRFKYINALVHYYDKQIILYRPKLKETTSISLLDYWISKIELEINKGDYEAALVDLEELHQPLLRSGFVEEYVRVAKKLFAELSWVLAFEKEYKYFHHQLMCYIGTITEFGMYHEATKAVKDYESLLDGQGEDYIELLDAQCYLYWYEKAFSLAISCGKRAVELKRKGDSSSAKPTNHYLLALRDSKTPENIQFALDGFLEGNAIDAIFHTPFVNEHDSSYFGNIGRCLWYQKEYESAFRCYKQSFNKLSQEKDTNTAINKGYAAAWICEYLIQIGDYENATIFHILAIAKWNRVSPPRATQQKELAAELKDKCPEYLQMIQGLSERELESRCVEFLAEH